MKSDNPYMFFCDLETSGFSPMNNDVIQIAGIVAKKDGNEIVKIDEFNEFCRPLNPKTWSEEAQIKSHGIKLSEAIKFPHPRKILIKFLHFLLPYKHEENHPLLFVCHAKNHYDFKFLRLAHHKNGLEYSFNKVFNCNNYKSTIDMMSKYKDVLGLENLKLSTIADYYGIELEHHEALSDVNCCFEIFKKIEGKHGVLL